MIAALVLALSLAAEPGPASGLDSLDSIGSLAQRIEAAGLNEAEADTVERFAGMWIADHRPLQLRVRQAIETGRPDAEVLALLDAEETARATLYERIAELIRRRGRWVERVPFEL